MVRWGLGFLKLRIKRGWTSNLTEEREEEKKRGAKCKDQAAKRQKRQRIKKKSNTHEVVTKTEEVAERRRHKTQKAFRGAQGEGGQAKKKKPCQPQKKPRCLAFFTANKRGKEK